MFGQWPEPLAPGAAPGACALAGAGLWLEDVVGALLVDDDVEAALAIAAPPPASKPVTAKAATVDLRIRIDHLRDAFGLHN